MISFASGGLAARCYTIPSAQKLPAYQRQEIRCSANDTRICRKASAAPLALVPQAKSVLAACRLCMKRIFAHNHTFATIHRPNIVVCRDCHSQISSSIQAEYSLYGEDCVAGMEAAREMVLCDICNMIDIVDLT